MLLLGRTALRDQGVMQGCSIFLVQILHVFWSLTYGEHLAHRSVIHTVLLTHRVVFIVNRLILFFFAQILSSFMRLWQCHVTSLEKVTESVLFTDMLTWLLFLGWHKWRYLWAKFHHLCVINTATGKFLNFLCVNDFVCIWSATFLAGDPAWIHRRLLTGWAHTEIVRISSVVTLEKGI